MVYYDTMTKRHQNQLFEEKKFVLKFTSRFTLNQKKNHYYYTK